MNVKFVGGLVQVFSADQVLIDGLQIVCVIFLIIILDLPKRDGEKVLNSCVGCALNQIIKFVIVVKTEPVFRPELGGQIQSSQTLLIVGGYLIQIGKSVADSQPEMLVDVYKRQRVE